MQAIAQRLRAIVKRAEPDAIERVRPGWRLIGYDVPGPRHGVYFAYVAPEDEHVHLGFEHGWVMHDPAGALVGEGINKRVRWLTFRPGDTIDDERCAALVREAALVATMSPGERMLRSMDADAIGEGS